MSTDETSYWRVVTPTAWPDPPEWMSVSTHADINACPRRWALTNAAYEGLWKGGGYPQKAHLSALAGSIVHLALEIISRQLARAGISNIADPVATKVLKELGGYTRIVEDCVERILSRYRENPRTRLVIERARLMLRGQVPTLRARTQVMLTRLRVPKVSTRTPEEATSNYRIGSRIPLGSGIYPELEVRAKSVGWKGKIDVLVLDQDVCEITDFKSGAADEEHHFQLRVYAVLWNLDVEINPLRRSASRLVLSYENQDVEVENPSPGEIGEIAEELANRKKLAEVVLADHPPRAQPSVEACRHCGVRQLCETYWSEATQYLEKDQGYRDIELLLGEQNGSTSWKASVLRAHDLPKKAPVLLRLQAPGMFKTGLKVRVLDAAFAQDPEDVDTLPTVTLSAFSEIYVLE